MPVISQLPEGYWWVIAITLLFAFPSVEMDSGGNGLWGRTANMIAMFLIALPIAFAMISMFAGLALFVFKTYRWLRYGHWFEFSLGDALWVIDVKVPYTQWVGIDETITAILKWSGLASLLFFIPLAAAVLAGLLFWLAYRVVNAVR